MSQTDTPDTEPTAVTATLSRNTLYRFLNPVNQIVDRAVLEITEAGFTIEARDPANVAMAEVHLEPGAFGTFEHPADGARIGIQVDYLCGTLETFVPGSDVLFRTDPNVKKYELSCGGFTRRDGWIKPESIRGASDYQALDDNARVCVRASELQQNIKRLNQLAGNKTKHCRFRYETDSPVLELSAEHEASSATAELDALRVERDAPADSMFSMGYLRDLIRPMQPEDEVVVSVGEEFLMAFEYAIDAGDIRMLMAPRITS